MERKKRNHHNNHYHYYYYTINLINRTTFSVFFFFLSISSLMIIFTSATTTSTGSSSTSTITCLDTSRCTMLAKADIDFHQELKKIKQGMVYKSKPHVSMGWGRRLLLGGPGSSPPRCTSKCGKCTPCKPVHVPVPPGTPVTAEYYPEAWRCKCGNKLYMP